MGVFRSTHTSIKTVHSTKFYWFLPFFLLLGEKNYNVISTFLFQQFFYNVSPIMTFFHMYVHYELFFCIRKIKRGGYESEAKMVKCFHCVIDFRF